MRRTVLALVLVGACVGLVLTGPFAGAESNRGLDLYQRHCASCHGDKGDGQGAAAYLLFPQPRDLTAGVYKFRSTPSGEPPTDADLLLTLTRGVAGTSMPAWDRLPKEDLLALVAHIKSFSDVFDSTDLEPPIVVGEPPPRSPASVEAGRQMYQKMGCFECHGQKGRGDGPASATLKDDKGRAIRPYDFTRGAALMKGGAGTKDIYRTMITGLDGTPMPSYAFLAEMGEQGWNLVRYIESLSTPGAPSAPTATPSLRVRTVERDPPLTPDDACWQDSLAVLVPLRPTWARDQWPLFVECRVLVGPSTVAFRLVWEDATLDERVVRPEDFRDAVAFQFVAGADPNDHVGIPFLGMGDRTTAVSIWHWKADWEADLRGSYRDAVVEYGVKVDHERLVYDQTAETLYLPGRAAGNPQSDRARTSSVEALVAQGFGTLTTLPAEQQVVLGHGRWLDGRWTVVLSAPLSGLGQMEKRRMPVAFAVWDGSSGDRNGQKCVSQWLELVFE